MKPLVITIDGPAGSGKSTVAKRLADRLGASFLDTGAMYRAVTLAGMEAGIDLSDENALLHVMDAHHFEFSQGSGKMHVEIDGKDVTEAIRDEEVTSNSRFPASAPGVRGRLVEMQRQFAKQEGRIVTEGRDQGTVAFGDANVKFFLTADAAERAKRRAAELEARGQRVNLQQMQEDIESRDLRDRNRDVGPLKQASDAIIVDTTGLGIEEVVDVLEASVRKKCC